MAGNQSLENSQRKLAECQKLLESVFPKSVCRSRDRSSPCPSDSFPTHRSADSCPLQVFQRLQTESSTGQSLTATEAFDGCTFLFAKIVGLNKLTAKESGVEPSKVVEILQLIFDKFDSLADLFLVQKVRSRRLRSSLDNSFTAAWWPITGAQDCL